MTRTARICLQRWLLAALCLLASVASALRGVPATGGASPAAHAVTSQPPAHHLHEAAQGGRLPAGCASGDLPASGQRHTAHCPFCATDTFAVDPPGEVVLAGARARGIPPGRPPLWTRPAPLGQADPRAPPVCGLGAALIPGRSVPG